MRLALICLVLTAVALTATPASGSAPAAHRYLVTAFGTGSEPPLVEILDQSGQVERVVAHPGHARSQAARWSPDGSMLAWIGHQGVVVERADGSGKSVLAPASKRCSDVCTGFSFAWSPDSRSLAIGGAGVDTNHLVVVAARGGKRVEVAPASRATNYFVVGWLPDGKSLVYERSSGTLGHAGCCRLDLRVAAADGGHARVAYRFPDPFYKGSSPSLSPNGRAIAYMTPSSDGRSNLIRVVHLRSGAVHAMDVGVVFDQAPAWSPDSRKLALARAYGEVVTVPADGGQVHGLGTKGAGAYWGAGGEVIILRGKRLGQVWVSRNGSPARFLFRVPGGLGIATIDAR
jgi:Tol biopolymer transport system component